MKKLRIRCLILTFLVSVILGFSGCNVSTKQISEYLDNLSADYQAPFSDADKRRESKIMESDEFLPSVIERIERVETVEELIQVTSNLEKASYKNDAVKAAFEEKLKEFMPASDSRIFIDEVSRFIIALRQFRESVYYYDGNSDIDTVICAFINDEENDLWTVLELASVLEGEPIIYLSESVQAAYQKNKDLGK